MAAEPKAPGAPAIFLYRQVDRDDSAGRETDLARIKILTEEGRKYADIEIPFLKDQSRVRDIRARRISHSRLGDRAAQQRDALRSVTKDSDKIKPIETLLSHSLSSFQITKASVENFHESSLPFRYEYSIVAPGYAKPAGNLLLVRPRVVGTKSSSVLEVKEPRQFPVEFDGPALDTDTFEITLPQGYVVDEVPPPVELNYSFATYRSKTEAIGNVLRYTRTFEIKELSVPLTKMEELKGFYRRISGDERNAAVLKPAGQ